MQLPSAIIFINDSVTTASLNSLATDTGIQPNGLIPNTPYPSTVNTIDVQLEINETMTFAEFNARVAVDPSYPTQIHLNELRILVILPDFHDLTNRELADIVLFVKQGLASVEKSKFGPPGLTLDVQRLNIWNLIYGIRKSNEACYPFPGYLEPPQTQTIENPKPHFHMERHHQEGFGALELFGVEALEGEGIDEGVFSDKLKDREDGGSGNGGEA